MNGPDARRTIPLVLAAVSLLGFTSATAVPGAFATASEDPASLMVSPRRVPVTSFYHGATLAVDVVVPSGSEIALKLEGGRSRVVFNRKGKVLALWMNIGEVTIGNAPQAYMLYTSTEPSELAPRDTLRRLGLGLEALEPQIETQGEGLDRETMLLEFHRYKEQGELYSLSYGSLRPDRSDSQRDAREREHYSASISLPSRIPVGTYEVSLFVFREGSLVERASDTVTIEKAGLPLFVSRLAREHPAEYGLLAIGVAVMAGFSIGLIFSRVGKRPAP